MQDTDPELPRRRFSVALDFRDLIGAAGALVVVGGAAMVNPGLAVMAVGAAAVGLAWRLSREP